MVLDVTFSETAHVFTVLLEESAEPFEAGFDRVQTVTEYVGGNPYEGEYTVTPKINAQTLPTKEKIMFEDVTIKAIPYYEVSNNNGGSTVFIAKEI